MIKWFTVLLLVAVVLAFGYIVQSTRQGAPAGSNATLAVFFACDGDPVPSSPRAVLRDAPAKAVPVDFALKELVKGPTTEEQEKGFSSFFSSRTDGMLNSVTVNVGGRAVVDFIDFRDRMNNASTSAGAGQLMGQLNKTVFQFEEIKEVEYRFNGRVYGDLRC